MIIGLRCMMKRVRSLYVIVLSKSKGDTYMDELIEKIKEEIEVSLNYYKGSDPVAYEGEILGLQEALDIIHDQLEIIKHT